MLTRYQNRMHLALALVVGLLLLANLFTLAFFASRPTGSAARMPLLLTALAVTVLISLPAVLLLPRWLLKPYRRLVDEAERAPVSTPSSARVRMRDETEFVLETFQEVVAQLRTKQAELEKLTERASARAATAEQFNERIIASVPSGLVAFDARARATVVNAPARQLLGADGKPEGSSVEELLRSAPGLAALVRSCMEGGEIFRREEVESLGADRSRRRLGVTVAPIAQHDDGGSGGALCLLTDITEVARLREALALKRNLESLGEMSAGLAHEFKNALATLHGYAQLLQNPSLNQEIRSGAAAGLLQEVRGLSSMVTAFLNFARPQPLELGPVQLRELLDECVSELTTVFEERRTSLSIEGEFPEVRADELMLRQAFLNLLRNAAEAVGEAREPGLVWVKGSREQSGEGELWAKVEIRDSGPGVPEADLQRIFIPFFTTKEKGHGVGLALAHRVVTDHGGTLTAANAPSGGALFTIRLPLRL